MISEFPAVGEVWSRRVDSDRLRFLVLHVQPHPEDPSTAAVQLLSESGDLAILASQTFRSWTLNEPAPRRGDVPACAVCGATSILKHAFSTRWDHWVCPRHIIRGAPLAFHPDTLPPTTLKCLVCDLPAHMEAVTAAGGRRYAYLRCGPCDVRWLQLHHNNYKLGESSLFDDLGVLRSAFEPGAEHELYFSAVPSWMVRDTKAQANPRVPTGELVLAAFSEPPSLGTPDFLDASDGTLFRRDGKLYKKVTPDSRTLFEAATLLVCEDMVATRVAARDMHTYLSLPQPSVNSWWAIGGKVVMVLNASTDSVLVGGRHDPDGHSIPLREFFREYTPLTRASVLRAHSPDVPLHAGALWSSTPVYPMPIEGVYKGPCGEEYVLWGQQSFLVEDFLGAHTPHAYPMPCAVGERWVTLEEPARVVVIREIHPVSRRVSYIGGVEQTRVDVNIFTDTHRKVHDKTYWEILLEED